MSVCGIVRCYDGPLRGMIVHITSSFVDTHFASMQLKQSPGMLILVKSILTKCTAFAFQLTATQSQMYVD